MKIVPEMEGQSFLEVLSFSSALPLGRRKGNYRFVNKPEKHDLNGSALQLSVTDHLVSDGFVLIKSIVLDPNFLPPNNDSPIAKIQKKDPPGPLSSCSSVDQVSYTRSKEY